MHTSLSGSRARAGAHADVPRARPHARTLAGRRVGMQARTHCFPEAHPQTAQLVGALGADALPQNAELLRQLHLTSARQGPPDQVSNRHRGATSAPAPHRNVEGAKERMNLLELWLVHCCAQRAEL